jgi:hypothetical protein
LRDLRFADGRIFDRIPIQPPGNLRRIKSTARILR